VRLSFAVLLAAAASSLYALSTSLQALEAREAPHEHALRASLLGRLARRRVWLLGGAMGIAGWGLQAGALTLASIALVQPALGLGLVVLLVLGRLVLGEAVGAHEIAGVAAIGAAVAVLGWSAPPETGSFTTSGVWVVGLALPVVAGAPFALRAARRAGGLATSVAAGLGWAWVGLGSALVDLALAERRWLAAVAWAVGVLVASWSTLLSEMTSLLAWPATRAIPIAFGLEMVVPAALAPLLTHHDPRHTILFAIALIVAAAGAVLLGSSRSVARIIAA
jgi:drug/metabolite transporter (DMT)-like permease